MIVLAIEWIQYIVILAVEGDTFGKMSQNRTPPTREVALHVMNYVVLPKPQPLDARRLLWTIIMALMLLGQLLVTTLLNAFIAPMSGMNMVNLTFICMLASTIGWVLRCFVAWKYFGELKREGREKRQHQWSALKNRNFKTGDILLTGSSTDPTAIVAEWGTLTAWGHVGCIIQSPALEVRAAFAIGTWLCRLPLHLKRPLMRKLHAAESKCTDVSWAALFMAQSWISSVKRNRRRLLNLAATTTMIKRLLSWILY